MSRLDERIENFNKAFGILTEAKNEYISDKTKVLNHMALIQSYEVCFELAWKVLKDYLAENGILVYLPKEVIKEAFNKRVIENSQLWINMLDSKNAISHEYKMDKVNIILENISSVFYNELNNFSKWLDNING